jgi:lysophospholipase L1-like esterase
MKILLTFAALLAAACAPLAPPTVLTALPPVEALPADAPFREEIVKFAEQDRETPPPACSVLFVGSSSIRLWTGLAQDMAPLPVINRGFGGSKISEVNSYFDRIVTPYRPRAIVFYAGENNIDANEAPAAVAEQFRQFLEMKRQRLGKTPVFYISAKPSKLRFNQLARQTELNEAVKAMAADDLIYIDVVGQMLSNGQPRDIYVEDGLHMSPVGYAIWRGLVRDALHRRGIDRMHCR